jgi:hypothetical protein
METSTILPNLTEELDKKLTKVILSIEDMPAMDAVEQLCRARLEHTLRLNKRLAKALKSIDDDLAAIPGSEIFRENVLYDRLDKYNSFVCTIHFLIHSMFDTAVHELLEAELNDLPRESRLARLRSDNDYTTGIGFFHKLDRMERVRMELGELVMDNFVERAGEGLEVSRAVSDEIGQIRWMWAAAHEGRKLFELMDIAKAKDFQALEAHILEHVNPTADAAHAEVISRLQDPSADGVRYQGIAERRLQDSDKMILLLRKYGSAHSLIVSGQEKYRNDLKGVATMFTEVISVMLEPEPSDNRGD